MTATDVRQGEAVRRPASAEVGSALPALPAALPARPPGPATPPLGPADLRAAAERIAPYVLRTPLLPGPATAVDGPRLRLKAEHLQPAGSFM
ncbi:hypothetical protein ACFW9W_43455, partial [Streptomyces sp. NPDC059468]